MCRSSSPDYRSVKEQKGLSHDDAAPEKELRTKGLGYGRLVDEDENNCQGRVDFRRRSLRLGTSPYLRIFSSLWSWFLVLGSLGLPLFVLSAVAAGCKV